MQHVLHVFDDLAVVLAKEAGEQDAGRVDALVDVRISIVKLAAAGDALDKFEHHGAEVHGFFARVGACVREQLLLEDVVERLQLGARVGRHGLRGISGHVDVFRDVLERALLAEYKQSHAFCVELYLCLVRCH